MWLENLKELKKSKGMTTKQIADATKIPESTIKRIFSGETDDPYVSTIHRIVTVLGGSLDHILADTNAVLASESLVEAKETAGVIEAERDLVAAENEMLKAKNAALTTELELLKKELGYTVLKKDENGMAEYTIFNEKRKIGVNVQFNADDLPYFVQWKMLSKGEYVMGLEPMNSDMYGPKLGQEGCPAPVLGPRESKTYKATLRFIDKL